MTQEKSSILKPEITKFLSVLSRRRGFIIKNVIAITLLATAVSFLLPQWYKGSVSVLPPKNTGLSGLGGVFGGGGTATSLARQVGALRALGSAPGVPDLYSYIAILKSRSLMERVVREFDLLNVYSIPNGSVEKAILELESNVDFSVNEEGTLVIEVYDRDAQRAAAMANFFAKTLDELNRELSVREAKSHRSFIEQRIERNLSDLKSAEEELKKFQQKNGIVAVSEQVQGAVSALAELYVTREKKALEVGLLERTVTAENPVLQTAKLELAELDAKLKNVPEQSVTYLRLYREFTVQQRLYEVLLPILEQARIEEARNTPTLLILDEAIVPEKASKPSKRIIVGVFFIFSLLVSVTVAWLQESLLQARVSNPEEYERLRSLWRELVRWPTKRNREP
jgi:tyrosine-protein kinase Etk/Wzc